MNDLELVFFDVNDGRYKTVEEIRICVFSQEQGVNLADEFDKYDKSAQFALLYKADEPAATARIAFTDDGFKIGRIAVLKKYRGFGLGRVIVSAVTERAFENGADKVFVDSQNYAVGFYRKLGFCVIGEEIIDRGLPHIPMAVTRENFLNNKINADNFC